MEQKIRMYHNLHHFAATFPAGMGWTDHHSQRQQIFMGISYLGSFIDLVSQVFPFHRGFYGWRHFVNTL